MIAPLLAGLALLTVPHPPAHASRSTAVGLGLREWRITVYRPTVRRGTVRFLMTNQGEDAHNLQVRGPHGYRSRVSADATPGGGHATFAVRLTKPGAYRLLCEKPGHAKLGMRATLTVK